MEYLFNPTRFLTTSQQLITKICLLVYFLITFPYNNTQSVPVIFNKSIVTFVVEVCQLSCYTLHYIHIPTEAYLQETMNPYLPTHSPILYFFNFIVTENINFSYSLNTGVR